MPRLTDLPERIYSKIEVEPNSGCWLWAGADNGHGYGSVWNGKKVIGAHVLIYRIFGNAIPDGLELDHLCRTRCCVNPQHLEPVTRSENTLRGDLPNIVGLREKSKTHCPYGHEYSNHNTRFVINHRGKTARQCKACANARKAVWRNKQRALREQGFNVRIT